ncbi:MAG: EamA family transporter [Pseudonocardiales bacterium]|nr:EamA family transporter [Pseudonocardiales bacterium]MBV9031502.1 EamA family transporter [Pseudonocardiales bacterium]MBW0011525.1 EamA family transporter [Pseudonocardiales bacterium]
MGRGNIVLGVLVAIIWGANFVVADLAVANVPPLLLVALRYLVVAVVFLPFTRRGDLPWRYIAAVGALYGVVQFSGLFMGLRLGVGAGVAATVIQSQALFTILLARVFLKESFGRLQWTGLVVSGSGLVLIALSGGGAAPLGGVLCVLLGAAGWAGSNIVLKKAGKISAWTMTVWQSVAVIPPMLLISGVFETGQRSAVTGMSFTTAAAILYIALLATGFGNYAWYRLIQQVGPSRTAPFSLLVPVVGVLVSWVALDQTLTVQQLSGVVLTLIGLTVIVLASQLTGWFRRRADRNSDTDPLVVSMQEKGEIS